MSYTIFLLDDSLCIRKEDFPACLEAVYAYHRQVNPAIECPGGVASFLAPAIEEKLVEAMAFFGWRPMLFDDGLFGLALDSPRRGDPGLLLALASHVAAGSVVEYIGEDGRAEKITYDGTTAVAHCGAIAYRLKT
jgi:hypothetical protein